MAYCLSKSSEKLQLGFPVRVSVISSRGGDGGQYSRPASIFPNSAAVVLCILCCTLLGVTLGVVLALLVITLMLMTAMYCCHRR